VGVLLEYDFAGDLFHGLEVLAQPAVVANGFFHVPELLDRQGDGDGFLGYFAGPLVTGASGPAPGAVLDRTLADVT